MVRSIVKEKTLYELPMQLIHRDCLPEFVVGMLTWYQEYQPTYFFKQEEAQIPNLFHLFEYSSSQHDYVANLFIKSDLLNHASPEDQLNSEVVFNHSVDLFNECRHFLFPYMIHDCRKVLDTYHLFYCYRDDASQKARYFNPYLQEVW